MVELDIDLEEELEKALEGVEVVLVEVETGGQSWSVQCVWRRCGLH